MNVMTEEEARLRACCGSGQRPAENGPCIASRCMAWRWPPHRPCDDNASDLTVSEMQPDGSGWKRIPGTTNGWKRPRARRGFCGLAGRPTP